MIDEVCRGFHEDEVRTQPVNPERHVNIMQRATKRAKYPKPFLGNKTNKPDTKIKIKKDLDIIRTKRNRAKSA